MIYVDVTVDNKSKYADGLFTYKSDAPLNIGDMVLVPFGRYDTVKKAIVCRILEEPDCPEEKIKFVAGLEEESFLSEEMVKTAVWMKQRYGIKYHDAFRCFIPGGKAPKAGKEKIPYKDIKGQYKRPEKLTDEQQKAADAVAEAMTAGRQQNFLLWGVTSSGKTEVYMEAIEKTVAMGKTAIMLVPEISLTKQVVETFAGRFGKEKTAVLHSKLTPRERYDEWQRIKKGNVPIVIGARLGVFAPLKNIGLIVMDEEQEASYKADMTPKYDTVDIALKRITEYGGVLLLGSATPSVVSYYRAGQGVYTPLYLTKRYNETPLPEVEIVDMRRELKEGNRTIFSKRLYDLIKRELAEKRQIILLQNRRGYSNFVSCRECGNVIKCPECGISLTYHKGEDKLICHYCGRGFNSPERCPECGSRYIKGFGIGTEQVEESVRSMFPDAVADRLDIDSLKTRRDLDRILGAFGKGSTDILIGTQLVAKGLDFDNVGLVGIIAADSGLNIPDYRSVERTFQLVTQAAGRAGRRSRQGRVIIQTYEPDNYALRGAARHDYKMFYDREIKMREFMSYPPFTDLIMVNVTAGTEKGARDMSLQLQEYMKKYAGEGSGGYIPDPKPASNFKGKDKFRFYTVFKCPKGERNRYVYYLECFNRRLLEDGVDCSIDIDVNPYSTF